MSPWCDAGVTGATVVLGSQVIVPVLRDVPSDATGGASLAGARFEPIRPGGDSGRGNNRGGEPGRVVLAGPDAVRTSNTPEEAASDAATMPGVSAEALSFAAAMDVVGEVASFGGDRLVDGGTGEDGRGAHAASTPLAR